MKSSDEKSWVVFGPKDLINVGEVVVNKSDGTTTTVTVGRVVATSDENYVFGILMRDVIKIANLETLEFHKNMKKIAKALAAKNALLAKLADSNKD